MTTPLTVEPLTPVLTPAAECRELADLFHPAHWPVDDSNPYTRAAIALREYADLQDGKLKSQGNRAAWNSAIETAQQDAVRGGGYFYACFVGALSAELFSYDSPDMLKRLHAAQGVNTQWLR